MAHRGPIRSAVPGRTDHVPLKVSAGSFVIPADIVSALGEGNSEAGHAILDQALQHGRLPRRAAGGRVVDILAAGGEYVIPPEVVNEIGKGDMKRGHDMLDRFVVETRKHLIKTLGALPGPVKG